MSSDCEETEVWQHVRCRDCGLIHAAAFESEPEPPLPMQVCRRCGDDTNHELVEIEEVRTHV